MAWTRPLLTDLVFRIETDLKGRLSGGDAMLRRAIERVLARVFAGAIHGLYGRLETLAKNLFDDSAEGEVLARRAAIKGLVKKPATLAAGPITVTGADDEVVPEGARLQRSDEAEYLVTAPATIVAGVATVTVVAAVAGSAGVAEEGTELTFVSPIGGISSSAVVATGGLVGGADEETDEELRARLLARNRKPPQGGAQADYEDWAKDISGVTRVWPIPERSGLGTVGVTFVMDGRADIIPLGGDLTIVANYIAAVRPVTAAVTVFAPTPVPLDLTIALTPEGSAVPEAVQAAVEAELKDLLAREAKPGGTILRTHITEAISIAAGELDHVLTVPAGNVTVDAEEMVVLGEITWS